MDHEDPAWIDYRNRFADVYDASNYASPIQARVMRASHKLVERPFGPGLHFGKVLEVGAGTGEHLPFVRHAFDEYTLTDLDGKTLEVARGKLEGLHPGKLRFEANAGSRLPYADGSFDRVVATHILEHISEPHLALKEWRRVLRDGGTLSVLIPTDPGFAWRFARHFGPRRNAVRQGIAYDYVMAREHVNSCVNLQALLRHYFPEAQEAWWPFPLPSVDANLFFAFNVAVRKPAVAA